MQLRTHPDSISSMVIPIKVVCFSFYIAQYPVRWTAQSALHFFALPGRPVQSDTNSASQGSIQYTMYLTIISETKSTLELTAENLQYITLDLYSGIHNPDS